MPPPKKKLVNTLTGSSARLLLPDLSFKVNDGWHYRNVNIYLEYLWAENLYCHLLIVADASMDSAKRATPDILALGLYLYVISRTDGGSQSEASGECASEACIFIIRVGKFLEHKSLQPETSSNVCYLQTLSESNRSVVTDRCILPFFN